MLSATSRFGKSAEDWKTMPTLRPRSARRRDILLVEEDAPAAIRSSSPAMMRSVVVLPHPTARADHGLACLDREVEWLEGAGPVAKGLAASREPNGRRGGRRSWRRTDRGRPRRSTMRLGKALDRDQQRHDHQEEDDVYALPISSRIDA